jgi:hypothetical protein
VGPAQDWNELIWDWKSLDALPQEDVAVSLYAVRSDQTDSLILEDISRGTYPLGNVDADEFPYMRLQADVADSVQLTAPQLDNWHVLYNPAADIVIDPITNWSFQRDTVMEGETIRLTCSARNVTDFDFDSLLVRFTAQWPDRTTQAGGPAYATRRVPAVSSPSEFSFDLATGGQEHGGRHEPDHRPEPGQ